LQWRGVEAHGDEGEDFFLVVGQIFFGFWVGAVVVQAVHEGLE
jgi:hypothetical protein